MSADGARSGAIAFGQGAQLDRYRRVGRYDVAFRLAANSWNGTVAPQLQVKRIFDTPEGYAGLRDRLAREWRLDPSARSAEALAIFAELGLDEDLMGAGTWSSRRPSARCCTSRHAWPFNLAAKGSGRAQGYNRTMATPVVTGAPERHRELFEELMREVAAYNPEADRDLLERAFIYGSRAHEGQQRRSGEDFILHPLGVARILGELGADDPTLAAALVHDVVEDTGATIEEVRSEFGDEVGRLVEGVTKLTRIQFQSREHAQAENYRKMIVAMAQDRRVILIKLADRLHNMRTIEYLGKQKQLQKARETLEVYAPLAHRLGIHTIKWELEDLAFETLHPRKYAEIQAMVNERRGDRRSSSRAPAKPSRRSSRRSTSPPTSPRAPSTSTPSTRRWPSAARSSTRFST